MELDPAAESAEGAGRHLETVRFAVPLGGLFGQGAGRTDRHAGAAELTSGFDVITAESGADPRARSPVLEREDGGAAHLLAHPDAAPAEDAYIIVSVEEGVVVFGLVTVIKDRIVDFIDTEPVYQVLQVALAVVRAVTATGRDPRLADRIEGRFALRLFAADEAA